MCEFKKIECEKIGDAYRSQDSWFEYYSPRHKKSITIPPGYPSNGANYVKDLHPTAFFVHDRGCEHGKWSDGSKMSNWQLSVVYYDVLVKCGTDKVRASCRLLATFLRGGGEARKNGMLYV